MPEERMVQGLGRVVEEWALVGVFHHVAQRRLFELRALYQLVEFLHVGLVVLVVVVLERLLGHVWLPGVLGVGESGQFITHGVGTPPVSAAWPARCCRFVSVARRRTWPGRCW